MTQTLQRFLDSARRQIRADTEDVHAWVGAAGADAAAGKALSGIAARVIAAYVAMEEIDRVFRESAGNQRPNAESAKRADLASQVFAAYAAVADMVLRSVDSLPAAQVTELNRLRDAAAELESVYRGEGQYFSGAPFTAWEDVRKQLGV